MSTLYLPRKTALTLAHNIIEDTWEKAKALYSIKGTHPTFLIKKYGFTTVARAYYAKDCIVFNENYLYAKNIREHFRNTVIHEVSHLVYHRVTGNTGHSPAWKKIFKSLGGDGSTCSSVDYPSNCTGTLFKCKCGEVHRITSRNKNPISSYCCSVCHTNLGEAKVEER